MSYSYDDDYFESAEYKAILVSKFEDHVAQIMSVMPKSSRKDAIRFIVDGAGITEVDMMYGDEYVAHLLNIPHENRDLIACLFA